MRIYGLGNAAAILLLFASQVIAAAHLPAAALEMHSFELAEHDPAAAIRAFSTQAAIQILASAEDLKGKQFNPVTGKVTTEDGLDMLLAGTGLSYRFVSERTVAVMRNGLEKL